MSQTIAKRGMRPSPPGELVREEILKVLDLSISRTAQILGVRRATLSDLVNGKATLSPEMALRIEKAFGVSMDTLLRMQAWHDSATMRQRADRIAVERYDETREQRLATIRAKIEEAAETPERITDEELRRHFDDRLRKAKKKRQR